MKSPIETFTNWVKTGKDEGMEKNHKEPVKKMIELILSSKKKFSIIDARKQLLLNLKKMLHLSS